MTPEEKRRIIRQRLEEFLALPLEEMLAIGEDPRNDGLFDTLQEMSDIVESCLEYPISYDEGKITSLPLPERLIADRPSVEYSSRGREENIDGMDLSPKINEDDDYSWAA